MSIQIKFFGPLAEVIGKTQLEIHGISDTDSLKQKMMNDFPDLKKYQFIIAVSKKLTKENINLQPGDEVAFLPPFAGG